MEHNSNGLGGGGGGSGGGSSNSMPLDYQPFKSRFLKTERSAALLKEEASESSSLTSKAPPVPGSLRSLRSTFSPLARLPENIEVRDGGGERLIQVCNLEPQCGQHQLNLRISFCGRFSLNFCNLIKQYCKIWT